MTGLLALWLPILLSAVAVFIISSIIHMALPWHRNDFLKVPREGEVMDALRSFAIPPGDYMMPRAATMAEMRAPSFSEKLNKGPVMVFTVLPNDHGSMARNLILWFIYLLVVSFFAAYVAGRALPPGARYLAVFRFVGVSAFLGYALALWQASIWFRRRACTTLKQTIDGLVYALVTAGIFGWLWPA